MLLRSNQDLFNSIKALAGVNDFTSDEINNLVELTNRRLTMAYNTSPMWDRFIVAGEKRNVNAFIIDGITDSSPTTVYNGAYYKLGDNANGGSPIFVKSNETTNATTHVVTKSSTTNQWILQRTSSGGVTLNLDGTVTYTGASETSRLQQVANDDGSYEDFDNPSGVQKWTLGASVSGFPIFTETSLVTYDETYFNSTITSSGKTSKTNISDFIRIHKDKSFLNKSSTEYDFYVDSNGANILNAENLDEVYVTYKKPMVDQTTGVVISSLTSGSQIPSEFFNYTAHAVYADFLRMDGQHDKAAFEEQKADMFLATELERIDIINNNNSLNHKFSTYVNTSSR